MTQKLVLTLKVAVLLPTIALFRWLAWCDPHLWRHWDVTAWRNWKQMHFTWLAYVIAVIGWIVFAALVWLMHRWLRAQQ